jgi:hypothetical protein
VPKRVQKSPKKSSRECKTDGSKFENQGQKPTLLFHLFFDETVHLSVRRVNEGIERGRCGNILIVRREGGGVHFRESKCLVEHIVGEIHRTQIKHGLGHHVLGMQNEHRKEREREREKKQVHDEERIMTNSAISIAAYPYLYHTHIHIHIYIYMYVYIYTRVHTTLHNLKECTGSFTACS